MTPQELCDEAYHNYASAVLSDAPEDEIKKLKKVLTKLEKELEEYDE